MKKYRIADIGMIALALSILLGVIGFLLNPSLYQFTDKRNSQREKDVVYIAGAIRGSNVDTTELYIPQSNSCVTEKSAEICKTGAAQCEGLVDLSVLVTRKVITAIPTDPTGVNENGTGYHIVKNAKEEIIICAPYAEDTTIQASLR